MDWTDPVPSLTWRAPVAWLTLVATLPFAIKSGTALWHGLRPGTTREAPLRTTAERIEATVRDFGGSYMAVHDRSRAALDMLDPSTAAEIVAALAFYASAREARVNVRRDHPREYAAAGAGAQALVAAAKTVPPRQMPADLTALV